MNKLTVFLVTVMMVSQIYSFDKAKPTKESINKLINDFIESDQSQRVELRKKITNLPSQELGDFLEKIEQRLSKSHDLELEKFYLEFLSHYYDQIFKINEDSIDEGKAVNLNLILAAEINRISERASGGELSLIQKRLNTLLKSKDISNVNKQLEKAVKKLQNSTDISYDHTYSEYPDWVEQCPDSMKNKMKKVVGKRYNYLNFHGGGVMYANWNSYKPVHELKDLSTLKYFDDLKSLEFCGQIIKDLSSLKYLTKLVNLRIIGSEVKDWKGLEFLTNLREVYIINVKEIDWKRLSSLTQLKKLNIKGTKISKAEMEALQKSLPNCKIKVH